MIEENSNNDKLNDLLDRAEEIAETKPDKYINRKELKRYADIFEKKGRITKEKAIRLRKGKRKHAELKEIEKPAEKPKKKAGKSK
jgi:hypothetical protein